MSPPQGSPGTLQCAKSLSRTTVRVNKYRLKGEGSDWVGVRVGGGLASPPPSPRTPSFGTKSFKWQSTTTSYLKRSERMGVTPSCLNLFRIWSRRRGSLPVDVPVTPVSDYVSLQVPRTWTTALQTQDGNGLNPGTRTVKWRDWE